MTLHAVASAVVSAVNPTILGTVRVSTGATTAADGRQTPTYATTNSVPMQAQALTSGELRQLEGLNIQGVKHGVYLYGEVEGVARARGKGGDLLTFRDRDWLVVEVLESWNGRWCKVAVAEQTQ